MAQKEKNKLFLRWLKGETRLSDEIDLFRMGQSDDFLAEAIEGYEGIPEGKHLARLTRLSAKLQKQHNQKRSTQWWKMAAIFAFLLIATFLLVDLSQQHQEQNIAQMEIPVSPPSKFDDLRPEPEASTAKTNIGNDVTPAPANPLPRKEIRKNKESQPIFRTEEIPQAYEIDELSSNSIVEGEVLEEKEEVAIIETPRTREMPPMESKRSAETDDEVLNTLALEQTSEEPPAFAQRKRSFFAEVPKPKEGFEQFEKYIAQNRIYPKEAKEKGVQGMVTIQFKVNRKGHLSDFLILKSLGYGCDQEAIRLLKDGPVWEADKETVTQYVIEFKAW